MQPLQHSPEEQELCIYRRCKLPVHLSRHLIVFMMGNVALLHLERFLKKIWQKRCGHKRLLPVVAVHEQFPENFEQELSRYAGHLFLLEGRCQSVDILHKVRSQQATVFLRRETKTRFMLTRTVSCICLGSIEGGFFGSRTRHGGMDKPRGVRFESTFYCDDAGQHSPREQ